MPTAVKTVNLKHVKSKDSDGNVTSWHIELAYTVSDYEAWYQCDVSSPLFTPKPASDFTDDELIALCPTSTWDTRFDQDYDTYVTNAPTDEEMDVG